MYPRLFYTLHILFNFLKGYIVSKTTNELVADYLNCKLAMLKAETSLCEEMLTSVTNDVVTSFTDPMYFMKAPKEPETPNEPEHEAPPKPDLDPVIADEKTEQPEKDLQSESQYAPPAQHRLS